MDVSFFFFSELISLWTIFYKLQCEISVGASRGCCAVVGSMYGVHRIVFAILVSDVGKWACIAQSCFSNWNIVLFQWNLLRIGRNLWLSSDAFCHINCLSQWSHDIFQFAAWIMLYWRFMHGKIFIVFYLPTLHYHAAIISYNLLIYVVHVMDWSQLCLHSFCLWKQDPGISA